jgi:Phage integrase family
LPVDLPLFLDEMLATQIHDHAQPRCACAGQHGGSGRYVFLGPDGGHHRRSNYARRVFRPACDGRHLATPGRPTRLVIADATTWPGIPIAACPPTTPATDSEACYAQRRGHGITVIPPDTPLACWLPIRQGLTPHGLRHSHKTWMAEDGIPEILAEQRLGHQVPGMRGLYAHASDRMRDDLKQALQARWQESLNDRAAINERSPVPLLDQLLAPLRAGNDDPDDQTTPQQTRRQRPAPWDREKMISQIPPKFPGRLTRATTMEGPRRASDLARHQIRSRGAKGT